MAKTITIDEVLGQLRGQIKYGYRQSDMARDAGVTQSYLYSVLSGHKPPSPKLLKLIDVERVTVTSYVQKEG